MTAVGHKSSRFLFLWWLLLIVSAQLEWACLHCADRGWFGGLQGWGPDLGPGQLYQSNERASEKPGTQTESPGGDISMVCVGMNKNVLYLEQLSVMANHAVSGGRVERWGVAQVQILTSYLIFLCLNFFID